MLVYHYDPTTLVFDNASSDVDPLLIPANMTPKVPPSVGNPKTQHAVFRHGAWVVEDKPVVTGLAKNVAEAPVGGMWPRMSIKEALKGGVT
jgi:hypothetical protein